MASLVAFCTYETPASYLTTVRTTFYLIKVFPGGGGLAPLNEKSVHQKRNLTPFANLPQRLCSVSFTLNLAERKREDEAVDPVAVRRITPFVRPLINPDQLPPDYLALLSLTFGVAGLMLKVHMTSKCIRSTRLMAVTLWHSMQCRRARVSATAVSCKVDVRTARFRFSPQRVARFGVLRGNILLLDVRRCEGCLYFFVATQASRTRLADRRGCSRYCLRNSPEQACHKPSPFFCHFFCGDLSSCL